MKNLQEYFERIVSWNRRAGMKFHEFGTFEWDKAVELQTNLLVEEATEAKDAVTYGDHKELVDGCVDTFVILSYLMAQLEDAGFDVEGAIEAVLQNNDKKIFNSYYEAVEAKEKLEQRDDVEYWIETSTENGLPFYTIRLPSGKIAKPVNFEKVNLEEFLP